MSAPEPAAERREVDLRVVPPAVAVWAAAGVALGRPPGGAAWLAALCLAAGLPSLALMRRRRGKTATGTLHGVAAAVMISAAVAAAVAGLTVAQERRGPVAALAARHGTAQTEVRLTGDPRVTGTGPPGAAGPLVTATAEVLRVRDGGTVTAVRTPVLVTARPGRFADRWAGLLPSQRLRARAVFAPMWRSGGREVAVLRLRGAPPLLGRPSRVQRLAGVLRGGLRGATERLPPDARALLPGLVVGDVSRMTPELRHVFEATDLLHLFAVSGANLGIVLALLTGPASRAGQAERRGLAARLGLSLRTTALAGGALTVAFVVLCRPDPSVLRAAVCGGVTLWAIGTGRRRVLLPALAATVASLVLTDPWLARSYGFALSVAATAALLTLAPAWGAALARRGVPARWAEAVGAAAAVQACCAPLVVVLAARVSLVAVPCNLLAEAAVAPATVLGFVTLAAAPVSMTAARACAWLASWPARWVAAVARRGAALPGAGLAWPGGWGGALLLALVTVAAVTGLRVVVRRRWWPGLVVAVALGVVVAVVRPVPLWRPPGGWPPPHWRLAVCDVGQGDALVLNAGPGAGVVVDTGPEPAAADRCLRRLGVRTVPLLLLTHFHADHAGGLPGVLDGRRVGLIETTTLDRPAGEARAVGRLARAAHVPVTRAVAGERRALGDLSWTVLWPPPGSRAPGSRAGTPAGLPDTEPNDASVVLLVRAAGLTLLLLGDLEPVAQRELLERDPWLAPVDVLKVAHHGSAYQDPELLRRLRPRLALVSVGAGNTYGHPAPRTLTALRSGGAVVLRTDLDGAIAVTGGGTAPLRAVTAGERAPPGTG